MIRGILDSKSLGSCLDFLPDFGAGRGDLDKASLGSFFALAFVPDLGAGSGDFDLDYSNLGLGVEGAASGDFDFDYSFSGLGVDCERLELALILEIEAFTSSGSYSFSSM